MHKTGTPEVGVRGGRRPPPDFPVAYGRALFWPAKRAFMVKIRALCALGPPPAKTLPASLAQKMKDGVNATLHTHSPFKTGEL